ncbi:MAG TPA: hypothetical protein VHV77_08680, partial [Pirellulales bacterium]|nr:hypothetical protein [Pirellulales bacterium]
MIARAMKDNERLAASLATRSLRCRKRVASDAAKRGIAALLIVAAAHIAEGADAIPGPPQERPVALVGGTVHPVSGPNIDNGIMLFDRGKITAVGKDVPLPENVETIDVKGQHVYPGLFDAGTSLGLVEIPSVRGSVDDQEVG